MTRRPHRTQSPISASAIAAASHQASAPVLDTARLYLRAPDVEDFAIYKEILSADQGQMGGQLAPADILADFTDCSADWMGLCDSEGRGSDAEAAHAARKSGQGLLSGVSYVDPENAALARLEKRHGAARDTGREATLLADQAEPILVWRNRVPQMIRLHIRPQLTCLSTDIHSRDYTFPASAGDAR